MEKEKLESLLIDYIDNRLTAADRRIAEEELSKNPDARKLHEELKEVIGLMERSATLAPTARLRANFDQMISEEVASEKTRTIFFRPGFYRAAAAIALMILSGFIGFWISKNNEQQSRLAEIESEMELNRKQLADTRQLMLGMLGNEQSASQRIRGVNVALEMSSADAEILDALFKAMLTDPSTNVRLAALDALSKFQQDPVVRKGLIAALSKQNDPLIQIGLIQIMVQMKEKRVIDDLQRIVNDTGSMKAVRDEAYSGILKLS